MAITMGYTTSLSDQVVLDTFFDQIQTGGSGSVSPIQTDPNQNVVSSYVLIGSAGDIVYENVHGDLQYMQSVPAGLMPMAATRIMTAGTVRGTPRTTTANLMSWMADYPY